MEEVSVTIRQILKKLQNKSEKLTKKQTYRLIPEILDNTSFNNESIRFFFEGDDDLKGICELSGRKNSLNEFKESSKTIINIIHYLLLRSKQKDLFQQIFSELDPFTLQKMNLGDHFMSEYKYNIKDKLEIPLEIAKVITDKRPYLDMSEIVEDEETLDLMKNFFNLLKRRKNSMKKKVFRFFGAFILNISRECLFVEPSTWDEVRLSKKKLLNVEENFIDNSIKGNDNIVIDEEKQIQNDYLNNFIDPLTENQRIINFGVFEEKDRKRFHLQSDDFDHIYFFERFYSQHSIEQMQRSLKFLQNNLVVLNFNEENLLDKNIYKYLDCKKFLDEMFDKHNNMTITNLHSLKSLLIFTQKNMLECISVLKNGFEQILNSKTSKDIIGRFKRYFSMKDEIEGFLKVSNFDAIADYFKKIKTDVDSISRITYIYGDFYSYFYSTIESVKIILINIIRSSITTDIIVSHFKSLLKFDVESEVIDDLYSELKEKVCMKIMKIVSYSVNMEVQLIKDFFCEEDMVSFKCDEFFSNISEKADRKIMIENNLEEIDEDLLTENRTELLDVDFLINSIFNEIKDFVFMMNRIEDIVKSYKFFTPRNIFFHQVIEEIYLLFFRELSDLFYSSSPVFKSNQRRFLYKCRIFKEKDINEEEKNRLFEFYEKHPDANTVFNEKLDKKRMKTVTDVIMKLLHLFEEHLKEDQIVNIIKLKTHFLEKFFISQLNNEFLGQIVKLNEMNSTNLNHSIYTLSNSISFSITNSFFKDIYVKYRKIIKSYINIVKNAKDVILDYDLIFLTYFFLIKSLYLNFIDFYVAEKSLIRSKEKNNCLVIEMLKNFTFLKKEVHVITKSLFKKRYDDIYTYFVDLENFDSKIFSHFYNIYIKNTGDLMFHKMFQFDVLYGDYNDAIIEKNFLDLRKYVVDVILIVIESINHLHTFVLKEQLKDIIQRVICLFLQQVKEFFEDEYKDSDTDYTKLALQYILELEFLDSVVLTDFLMSESSSLLRKIVSILYRLSDSRLRKQSLNSETDTEEVKALKEQTSEIIELNEVNNSEELERRVMIITKYKEKYSFLISCLKIPLD